MADKPDLLYDNTTIGQVIREMNFRCMQAARNGLSNESQRIANAVTPFEDLVYEYYRGINKENTSPSLVEQLQNQIDSERETNHILTQEVEILQNEIELLKFNQGKI